MTEDPKETPNASSEWGGARSGAGRPKGSPTRPIAFRLKEEEAVKLEALARPEESLVEVCRRLLVEATNHPQPPIDANATNPTTLANRQTCWCCGQTFDPSNKRRNCRICNEPLPPGRW